MERLFSDSLEYIPQIQDMGREEESKLLWARGLFRQRDYVNALAECNAALEINPQSAATHYFIALIHTETTADELALAACHQALRCMPAMVEAKLLMGRLESRRGNTPAALKLYKQAFAKEPDNALILHMMGDLHRAHGDHAKALKAFRKATKINGDQYTSFYRLAQTLLDMGKTQQAASALASALRFRRSPTAYILLGDILLQQQKSSAALAEYYRALELAPHLLEGHIKAGVVLLQMKQYILAIRQFRISVSIDPQAVDAHFYLGKIYQALGKLPQAATEYRRCLDLAPERDDVVQELAILEASITEPRLEIFDELFQQALGETERQQISHLMFAEDALGLT